MKRFALIAVAVLLSTIPALAGGGPGNREAPERTEMYSRVHRDVGFNFDVPGAVEHEQTWPDVCNPRKFTLHAVFPAGRTLVYLFVFDLVDKDADWWLSEVVGFLFEPENLVSAGLTPEGYDYYLLEMPGGGGAPPFTEALVITPGRLAFRFTCQDCHALGAAASLDRMLDTLLVDPDSGAR